MVNFDCDTENICGKLIWSERLSVAVMCIGVNSFSILCFGASRLYKSVRLELRLSLGMKVKNGNEIIKFALTAGCWHQCRALPLLAMMMLAMVRQPSRLHARCTMHMHTRSTSSWIPSSRTFHTVVWYRLSVQFKPVHFLGQTKETWNFSGFCFATLDLFLLLLLFSVYVLFVSFSLGCSEQKTDRDGEMEKDTTNTQRTSTWHFQRANEQTNGGKFMERLLARDFSQHYQWNMHHDCVQKSRGLIPKDTNI